MINVLLVLNKNVKYMKILMNHHFLDFVNRLCRESSYINDNVYSNRLCL